MCLLQAGLVLAEENVNADSQVYVNYTDDAKNVSNATVIGKGNTKDDDHGTSSVSNTKVIGDNNNIGSVINHTDNGDTSITNSLVIGDNHVVHTGKNVEDTVVIGNAQKGSNYTQNLNADRAVIIGNEANAFHSDDSVAIGYHAWIWGRDREGYPSKGTGDIAIGSNAWVHNYVNQGGSIALGERAMVTNMFGSSEQAFSFGQTTFTNYSGSGEKMPDDPSKMSGGIAIGKNSISRSDSINIGVHQYEGAIGDITIAPEKTQTENWGMYGKYFMNPQALTVGTNSFNQGSFTTLLGSYSVISGSYAANKWWNFGATAVGDLNSIESATASKEFPSGVATTITGVANRVYNSNSAVVIGAGNEITNAVDDRLKATTDGGTESVKALADNFRANILSNEGGATIAVGVGNKADSTVSTQIIGTANTVTNTSNTLVAGTHRTVSNANNSVIIGAADEAKTTDKAGVTVIGHNANATEAGAVAIGENSVASTAAGVVGYDPATKAKSTDESSVWKATNAAVSVGDGTTVTRQITGVAAGWADTDAVNVAQLKKVAANAASSAVDAGKYSSVVAGDNITVTKNAGANAAKGDEYKVALNDKVRVADSIGVTNGPVMSTTGIDAAGNKITNVAAGSADTDAVNVSQLKGVDQRVTNNTQAIQNINQNVDNMGHRINNLDSKINKVGAGAAALAALHPQDFNSDDKWDFAAGFGNYRDANAVALGAFYRPDHKTMFSVGSSFGNGENMVNVGVSLKFGKSSPYTGMSKADLVNQLEDQKQEISDLKAQNAAQNGRIEKLEQLVEKLLAAK